MKTTWDWSLASEAERVIDTAQSISNGFFHLHHFYPLPWQPNNSYLHQGVYLPAIAYKTLPEFWHKSLSYDNKNMRFPPLLTNLHQAIIDQLTLIHLSSPDFSTLQTEWDQIAPRFFSLVKTLAPYTPVIKSLTIHPTYFGTASSFNWGDQIVVYLRIDQPITTLAECILTALTRPYLSKTRSASWEESEFLVDYLLQETELAKLFSTPHHGTLAHLRANIPTRIIKESTQFLSQIGAPNSTENSFTLKNSVPHFGDTPLTCLTSRESLVMNKLIDNSPTPVTYDELSDILFPNPDKFSLAALTKSIERLRAKLNDMGISRHYISTASGVGYYLKS